MVYSLLPSLSSRLPLPCRVGCVAGGRERGSTDPTPTPLTAADRDPPSGVPASVPPLSGGFDPDRVPRTLRPSSLRCYDHLPAALSAEIDEDLGIYDTRVYARKVRKGEKEGGGDHARPFVYVQTYV